MQIRPIQQPQYQTANPSFQRLKGVRFVENTVRADGRNYVLKANKFFDAKKLTKLIEEDWQFKAFFKKFDGWVEFSEDINAVRQGISTSNKDKITTCRRHGIMTIRYEDHTLKETYKGQMLNFDYSDVIEEDWALGDNLQNAVDWYSKLIKTRTGANSSNNNLLIRHEIAVKNHYNEIEKAKKFKAMEETKTQAKEQARIAEEKARESERRINKNTTDSNSESEYNPYDDVIYSGPW